MPAGPASTIGDRDDGSLGLATAATGAHIPTAGHRPRDCAGTRRMIPIRAS